MVDPRMALAAFVASVAVALAVGWPRRGLWARARRALGTSERVRVEDAVKYLYYGGTGGRIADRDALAQALQLRHSAARRLMVTLTNRGLATAIGSDLQLTDAGRAEALRIIRSHRLTERFLADRTGLESGEWHAIAEEREHLMSAEEVNALAVRLGQPRFDPHGDPIPTATGELPAVAATPLTGLAVGEAGMVVHLEDEPTAGYDRLEAMGFALGRIVVVRERDPQTVVDLEGAILVLTPALEQAIDVAPTPDGRRTRPRTLADLKLGERRRVVMLSSRCRGAQRRRLLDLGVVPGTEIVAEMRSAVGDPIAYRIRGALIALRRQQAEWIEIEPVGVSTPEQSAGAVTMTVQ